MSVRNLIKSSKRKAGRRCVIYSTHGWGKSTLASKFPKPIFIPTEDGLSDLDVDSFPVAEDWLEVMGYVNSLHAPEDDASFEPHDYKTVVIDTADWLEQIIWRYLIEQEKFSRPDTKIAAITDFPYGEGYGSTAAKFRFFLHELDCCRNRMGMNCVVLAHCKIAKFSSPDNETFDMYCPKMHHQVSSMLQEWADEVFFGHYRVRTKKVEEGFKRTRNVGIGGDRVIMTRKAPGWDAKSRCDLPDEMSPTIEEYLPYLVS